MGMCQNRRPEYTVACCCLVLQAKGKRVPSTSIYPTPQMPRPSSRELRLRVPFFCSLFGEPSQPQKGLNSFYLAGKPRCGEQKPSRRSRSCSEGALPGLHGALGGPKNQAREEDLLDRVLKAVLLHFLFCPLEKNKKHFMALKGRSKRKPSFLWVSSVCFSPPGKKKEEKITRKTYFQ